MRNAVAALIVLVLSSVASADTVVVHRPSTVVITSAQAHAETLANSGSFHHSSCNQYEGIGTGSTPEQARRNCCLFGRRKIVEEGVAWSPIRRRWIAVIRYQ
jgi:hypothetical protein